MADRQTFRSPLAAAIWWLWVLFAVGNLIDLAVQGRDHLSVVAAFILVLVTGVVYTTAQRPRIIAADDGLTILNPLRDHRIGWAAVAQVEATDLVRVRCEWPLGDGDGPDGDGPDGGAPDDPGTGKRAIYSWAVQAARRKQYAAQMRTDRRRPRSRPRGGTGFGVPPEPEPAPPPATVDDVATVVGALSARAEQAHAAHPGQRAVPPVSTWYWPSFALILVPALALVIAILA